MLDIMEELDQLRQMSGSHRPRTGRFNKNEYTKNSSKPELIGKNSIVYAVFSTEGRSKRVKTEGRLPHNTPVFTDLENVIAAVRSGINSIESYFIVEVMLKEDALFRPSETWNNVTLTSEQDVLAVTLQGKPAEEY